MIGAFPMPTRRALFEELQPLVTTFDDHPWAWARQEEGDRTPRKAEGSRWNANKDLSFIPLRPERVVEVRYDYMEGVRFRHTAQFVRWRPDREPSSCTYEQLEQPVTFDLAEVLGLPDQVAASWPQAAAISWPRVSRTVQATPAASHPSHELVLRACAARRPTRCPASG